MLKDPSVASSSRSITVMYWLKSGVLNDGGGSVPDSPVTIIVKLLVFLADTK